MLNQKVGKQKINKSERKCNYGGEVKDWIMYALMIHDFTDRHCKDCGSKRW